MSIGNSTPGSSLLPAHGAVDTTDGGLQLSKLSSVLNGLEGGAQLMQRHAQETLVAIRAGTYHVDPMQLSKRIIGEALRIV
jgi:hypothetical protein